MVTLETRSAKLDYEIEEPDDLDTEEQREVWNQDVVRTVRLFDPLHHSVRAIREMRECVEEFDKKSGNGDESMVAKILKKINGHLTGNRFRIAFTKERRPSGFAMQIMPSSLLGALWVQFGQAIVENKKFRSWAECRRWFEVSPSANRTSRRYCKEACRSRAYRNRKEQAIRMAESGKTTKEIAHALQSTTDTANKWLRQSKGVK